MYRLYFAFLLTRFSDSSEFEAQDMAMSGSLEPRDRVVKVVCCRGKRS